MFYRKKRKYIELDGYLWGKLIKTNIYTNSLKIISKQIEKI